MHGEKVKALRSDNGREYTSNAFNKLLKECGIQHQLSCPRTPQQNGVAERINRTIVEAARSMLHGRGVGKEFWAEAIATAVYVRNRCTSKVLPSRTPMELWSGEKPNVEHLRVFGCKAFVHIPREKRGKMDAKASECIFGGYADSTKGYRLWDKDAKRLVVSRDVVFYEEDDAPSTQQQELVKEDAAAEEVVGAHKEETPDVEEPSLTSTTSSNAAEPTQESECTNINMHERRYTQRERKAPKPDGYWYDEEEAAKQHKMAPHESHMAYAIMGVLMDGEPRTLEEALSRPDQAQWRKAAE